MSKLLIEWDTTVVQTHRAIIETDALPTLLSEYLIGIETQGTLVIQNVTSRHLLATRKV